MDQKQAFQAFQVVEEVQQQEVEVQQLEVVEVVQQQEVVEFAFSFHRYRILAFQKTMDLL
jgi:hypothetical protein